MWTVYYTDNNTNERKMKKFKTEEEKETFYKILRQQGNFKKVTAAFGMD